MSPDSFAFTLTVPRDSRLAGVVRDLCAHAVTYARLPAEAGGPFCDQVLEVTKCSPNFSMAIREPAQSSKIRKPSRIGTESAATVSAARKTVSP